VTDLSCKLYTQSIRQSKKAIGLCRWGVADEELQVHRHVIMNASYHDRLADRAA